MIVHHRHRRRALTMLEMIISTGLMVVLLSLMFLFYNTAVRNQNTGAEAGQKIHLARVVVEQMSREIRQSVASMATFGPGVFGYHDRERHTDIIEINTVDVPDKKLTERRKIRDRKIPGQLDVYKVKYYIAWDDENLDDEGNPRPLGLVRRESKTYLRTSGNDGRQTVEDLEAVAEGEDVSTSEKEELYAPEIKYLKFHYFDGATWWSDWTLAQENSLPQIVRITVGFVPEMPEDEEVELVEDNFLKDEEEMDPLPSDRFTVFVRLAQADVLFRSRISREASAMAESEASDY